MRYIVIACLSFCLLAACGWSQSMSALESEPDGWIDLLSDSSLKGWTRGSIPPTDPLQEVSRWVVDSATATLICDGDKTGHEWLRFDRELSDFICHVEWRFTKVEGEKRYNSGVFVRTDADGIIWLQAQMGSASGGFIFGSIPVNGAPQRINLRDQVKENRVLPAGEWNVYEVRAEGRTLSLWVNGAASCVFKDCTVPRGYFGLEAEGYRVEFRNVKLKELPAGRP